MNLRAVSLVKTASDSLFLTGARQQPAGLPVNQLTSRRRLGLAVTVSTLVLSCVGGSVGCRFKAPSVAESNTLVSGDAFPGKVPLWVNQRSSESPRETNGAGVVPSSFGVPGNVAVSRLGTPNGNSELRKATEQLAIRGRLDSGSDDKQGVGSSALGTTPTDANTNDAMESSPLDRITRICPSIESQVNDALVTTETTERIKKYESLTGRCQESWDLWLWLGKDYQSIDENVKAVRCFEKVLLIDPSNEVGAALLSVAKKKVNSIPE